MAAEVAVSVLVPTHDHGDLIRFSLRSLQRQTLADFEVLVVGDGMTDAGRSCVLRFASADPRIRLFEFAKGPRHGEVHRAFVLREHARGHAVVYLGDDDLLLPDALAALTSELRTHDFVHPLPTFVDETGAFGVAAGHLGLSAVVRTMIRRNDFNFVSLTGVCHTMAIYRALPFGWRTTPAGVPTDLFMWQQLLAAPDCRARTLCRPLTVHFPSAARAQWSRERRTHELEHWERLTGGPDGERLLATLALEQLALARAVRELPADA